MGRLVTWYTGNRKSQDRAGSSYILGVLAFVEKKNSVADPNNFAGDPEVFEILDPDP